MAYHSITEVHDTALKQNRLSGQDADIGRKFGLEKRAVNDGRGRRWDVLESRRKRQGRPHQAVAIVVFVIFDEMICAAIVSAAGCWIANFHSAIATSCSKVFILKITQILNNHRANRANRLNTHTNTQTETRRACSELCIFSMPMYITFASAFGMIRANLTFAHTHTTRV